MSFTTSNLPEYVFGDKERLRRVLSNLLSNAIRYNKKYGHVDFIIENLGLSNGAYKIRFTVSDDGIGFDPEKTMEMLVAILGEQTQDKRTRSHLGSDEHLVPAD